MNQGIRGKLGRAGWVKTAVDDNKAIGPQLEKAPVLIKDAVLSQMSHARAQSNNLRRSISSSCLAPRRHL